MDKTVYEQIRAGRPGFREQSRGLIAISGKEAVPFLDGMISNDMKTLEDGGQMLAAFPNAQGRLLAVVRVLRSGEAFMFETEAATREKLFQNVSRFTLAGDFFVDDLSDGYRYFEIFSPVRDVYHPNVGERLAGALAYQLPYGAGYFVPTADVESFRGLLTGENRCVEIDADVYETLRIEAGVPLYGIDMDETTIVPELGLDEMISYTKGCYIGQEIIARIHFRGHVAKQLKGIRAAEQSSIENLLTPGIELTSPDGRNAGKITSSTFSPQLGTAIGLAYVRYEHLAEGTKLDAAGTEVEVCSLPFIAS